MTKMVSQLTLGVGLKDEATFANFYAGKNTQLLEVLKQTAQGHGEQAVYFYGSFGEGWTHLLQAACHEAKRYHLRAVYIPLSNLQDFSPDIFDNLETCDLVCIDDIHRLSGKKPWEEAFFHAYNRIRDQKTRLIMTANVTAKQLAFTLPDLISRLTSCILFQLHPLNDEEKLKVLIMRASRRGMILTEEVGKFILTHCPRHMTTLFSALDTLDKVSLAAQRKLTIPFIKTVLQI